MKKLYIIATIICFAFVMNGCTKTTDLEDDTVPEALVDDIYEADDDIDNDTNDINDNNVSTNTNNETNVTDKFDDVGYTTSLGDIDSTLRKTITDMDATKVDVNDANYLPSQVTYYKNSANAYKTALDKINALSYNKNNEAYRNAVIGYYQNGYDMYNNLGTKYGTFKTIDDETSYREGEGKDAYDIKTDLRDAYEDALDNMGVDVTKYNR